MTKYQQAIDAARSGDTARARQLMEELPTWDYKVGILHALAEYEFNHKGDPYALLIEAYEGIKRIKDESTRGENFSWHCYHLTKLGYESEAISLAEELEGPYQGDKQRAYLCIALAQFKLNKPYEFMIHKAGEISKQVDESMDEGVKGLGQAFFRDNLYFVWVKRGFKDEVMPFVDKYITDPIVKDAALKIFAEGSEN